MNRAHLQSTLRQLRDSFRNPVTLAALGGVAVVMGISGPFDTIRAFSLPARLAYWGLVVPLTYAAGMFGSVFMRPFAPQGLAAKIALHSLGSAVMVSATLAVLNTALRLPLTARDLALGFGAVYVICLVIEVMGHVISAQVIAAQDRPKTPAILSRLPLEKRGTLVALEMQDHYVEVTTTKGSALILLRLSDAIAECAPTQGLQIHRSTWVALDQVARARRTPDAAVLVLRTGAELPVARSRVKAIQNAGLLPRRGE